MRLLERALRKSQAIDVESLCVVNAKHVWSVRCDVTVLDDGGNLADAALLAALAALRHLRLPAVRVDGTGDEASVRILTEEQGERQPLVFHHTPVSVSLGISPAERRRWARYVYSRPYRARGAGDGVSIDCRAQPAPGALRIA